MGCNCGKSFSMPKTGSSQLNSTSTVVRSAPQPKTTTVKKIYPSVVRRTV